MYKPYEVQKIIYILKDKRLNPDREITAQRLVDRYFTKFICRLDLIVIDEAHHSAASTYEEIINWNKQGNPCASLLGVTATPNRGDKLPLIHLFDNFYQVTSKYLIESHYLVRPKFIDLSPVFECEGKTEKGHLSKYIKYDDEGMEKIKKLCMDFVAAKEDGKSILFAPSHEICAMVYACLKDMGRNPAYLSFGLDNASRRAELDRFENGECEELINVDICTEGYDYPPLRNLVDFDTNGTHGQWVQKVGRVLRCSPQKTTCTVIDFGGNVELYPDGVETDVLLEGVFKGNKGSNLSDEAFFRNYSSDADTKDSHIIKQCNSEFTPYHLPQGFESVCDKDYGIIFVSCGSKRDIIIVPTENEYTCYLGNKISIDIFADNTALFSEKDIICFEEDIYSMSRKPEINITGNLCFEPRVGYRAFIEKDNGETIYTSQVVDVRNKIAKGVEIETKNTIYKVTFSAESLPLAS